MAETIAEIVDEQLATKKDLILSYPIFNKNNKEETYDNNDI